MGTYMGWVLLYTIYTGGYPQVRDPEFYASQEECEAAYTRLRFVVASRRGVTVDGRCFDTSDPRIRQYLNEELALRERGRK